MGELFFFSSRRRHTRSLCDWSSDVCSSDLGSGGAGTASAPPPPCGARRDGDIGRSRPAAARSARAGQWYARRHSRPAAACSPLYAPGGVHIGTSCAGGRRLHLDSAYAGADADARGLRRGAGARRHRSAGPDASECAARGRARHRDAAIGWLRAADDFARNAAVRGRAGRDAHLARGREASRARAAAWRARLFGEAVPPGHADRHRAWSFRRVTQSRMKHPTTEPPLGGETAPPAATTSSSAAAPESAARGRRRLWSGQRPRAALAIVAGRSAGALARRLRPGGGTSLPGLLARPLDPPMLADLRAQLRPRSVAITRTHGQTTNSRLAAALLRRARPP